MKVPKKSSKRIEITNVGSWFNPFFSGWCVAELLPEIEQFGTVQKRIVNDLIYFSVSVDPRYDMEDVGEYVRNLS